MDFIYPSRITYEQVDLSWMIGRCLSEVLYFDPSIWRFGFEPGSYIQAECPWRVIQNDYVVLTSEDHGQQFGLPAPIDAVSKATDALTAVRVSAVLLRKATADILIEFDRGLRLEIIPLSRGYEGWQVHAPGGVCFVAQGGGQLCTWREDCMTPPNS